MAEQAAQSDRKAKLYRLRHSAAHIMAQAVLEIFPDAKLAIGPPIADGFYYDFDLPRSLNDADLAEIEKRMKKIVKSNRPFEKSAMSKEEGRAFFADQPYKLELIEGIEDEALSIFKHDAFTDLCAGPHVRRTKQCKHFKLLSVAGAYWRGDSDKPMLQRIYGTVWPTKDELDGYLGMREEAKRRDHRRLGKDLDLFSFHHYSPGAAFWHPKGVTVYDELVNYWKQLMRREGYVEIRNPLVYDSELYATSGHLDHYRENMFTMEVEGRLMCLKPMNCPDTMLFYKTRKRSYRELPLRVAENQILHRNELSGALTGLTRVRQFAQDDAHIFVMPEQIQSEISSLLKLIDELYARFDLGLPPLPRHAPRRLHGQPRAVGRGPKGACAKPSTKPAPTTTSTKATGPSMAPRSTSISKTASAARSNAPPSSSTSSCPNASNSNTSAPTTRCTAQWSSTAPSSAPTSASSASSSSTSPASSPPGSPPPRSSSCPSTTTAQSTAVSSPRPGPKPVSASKSTDRQEKIGYKIRQAEMAKTPYMLVVGAREVEEEAPQRAHLQRRPQGHHETR